jgi:hypothetical protein
MILDLGISLRYSFCVREKSNSILNSETDIDDKKNRKVQTICFVHYVSPLSLCRFCLKHFLMQVKELFKAT